MIAVDTKLLAYADRRDSEWHAPARSALVDLAEGYWPRLQAIAGAGRVRGAMVHDARVAALCQLHGVRELWTADRDFGRYADLRTRNPLVD